MNLNKDQIKGVFDRLKEIEKHVDARKINRQQLREATNELRQYLVVVYLHGLNPDIENVGATE